MKKLLSFVVGKERKKKIIDEETSRQQPRLPLI